MNNLKEQSLHAINLKQRNYKHSFQVYSTDYGNSVRSTPCKAQRNERVTPKKKRKRFWLPNRENLAPHQPETQKEWKVLNFEEKKKRGMDECENLLRWKTAETRGRECMDTVWGKIISWAWNRKGTTAFFFPFALRSGVYWWEQDLWNRTTEQWKRKKNRKGHRRGEKAWRGGRNRTQKRGGSWLFLLCTVGKVCQRNMSMCCDKKPMYAT